MLHFLLNGNRSVSEYLTAYYRHSDNLHDVIFVAWGMADEHLIVVVRQIVVKCH